MLFSDKHKWFTQAKCTGNTNVFFPEIKRGGSARREYKQALAICKECPVIKECLEYSLSENLIEFGIFGGQTPTGRKNILRVKNRS